jgi:ankyrin repeat protein
MMDATLNHELLLNLNTIEESAEINFSSAISFIDNGADVNLENNKGETILMIAAKVGNIEIINELIKIPGILLNKTSLSYNTALTMAARDGRAGAVSVLVKVSDDIAKRVYFPIALRYAAESGYVEVIKALLAFKNIQVNEADIYGYTPLMYAATNGHFWIVQALLDYPDINLNLKNKSGETAIVQAYNKGYNSIVELLQTYGAFLPKFFIQTEPESKNENNEPNIDTPTPDFVEIFSPKIMPSSSPLSSISEKLLAIELGLNEQLMQVLTIPEGTTKVNLTPAIALVALGANINLENEHGETILMLAKRFGDKDTLSKLLVFSQPQSNALSTPLPTVIFRPPSPPVVHLTEIMSELALNPDNNQKKTAVKVSSS